MNFLTRLDKDLPKILRIDEIRNSIRKHSAFLFFIFVAGLLSYSYDIFEFTLHIDAEIEAFKNGPHVVWLREGRWGVYFLNAILLPDPVVPVIPVLVAILGYGIGIFFFVKTLSANRGMPDYLAAMIAIGCPILYFAFYWQSLAYALGIAFAVINIGMYYLVRWTKTGFAFAIVCFCFGIGVYQALAPVIVVIYGMYFVNSLLENRAVSFKKYIFRCGAFGIALAIALVLYKAVTFLTLLVYGQPYNGAYMANFVNFEFTTEYFFKYIPAILQTLFGYYTGEKIYYLYELTSLKLLFCFSLAVVAFRILIANISVGLKLLGLFALLATLVVPAMMLLMNAGVMPARTMITTVFVMAGLVFIASTASSNIVKSIVFTLVVICYVNFVVINHRYALSSHLAWQADREFSLMLLDRINEVYYKLPPKEKTPIEALGISTRRYPLDIVGAKERYGESPVLVQREAFGASFYTWVYNEVRRQVGLFAVMGNFDFWPASRTDRRSIIDQVLKMPSWPAAGSVDVINGIVVIKFGDYDPTQVLTLCVENDDNPHCQKLLQNPKYRR